MAVFTQFIFSDAGMLFHLEAHPNSKKHPLVMSVIGAGLEGILGSSSNFLAAVAQVKYKCMCMAGVKFNS